ncbi:MAG: 30S ribosomal protein S19e [Infirmifilum sp.]
MVNAKYIPPNMLVEELAKYLKENVKEIRPPEWAYYAKTGPTRERVPSDPEWWYKRCAALLRKVYIYGPVGIERLRTAYGGRTKNTVKRKHFRKSGGAAIRKALQQLEAAGLVTKTPKGRVLTDRGRAIVDKVVISAFKRMAEERPELKKYIE